MVPMKDYATEIHELVKQCNEFMGKFNLPFSKKYYAFLDWRPCVFEAHTDESAFAREAVNYYQLIGESAKYLWQDKFMKYMLTEYDFDLIDYKENLYEIVRSMRLFYSHKPDINNLDYLDVLCKYLEIDFDYYADMIDCEESVCIDGTHAFWGEERKKLYNDIVVFLKDYLEQLKKVGTARTFDKKNRFADEMRSAMMKVYPYEDQRLVRKIVVNWFDQKAAICGSSKEASWINDQLDNETWIERMVSLVLNRDELKSIITPYSKATDFRPHSVFEAILETNYTAILNGKK